MKKLIFLLSFVLCFTLTATVHAGVNETKVANLLQKAWGEEKSETQHIIFNLSGKDVTAITGKKAVTENYMIKFEGDASYEMTTKNTAINGTVRINSPEFTSTLPVSMLLTTENGTEYFYVYMHPEYSQLVTQLIGIDILKNYSGKWLKMLSEDIDDSNPATDAADIVADPEKYNFVWKDSKWLTATPRKVGTQTTYTIKINPSVFMARAKSSLNVKYAKLTPADRANRMTMLRSILEKVTIQLVEQNGTLTSTYVNFGTHTNTTTSPTYDPVTFKRLTQKNTSTVSMNLKFFAVPFQPVVVPSSFMNFSMDDFEKELKASFAVPAQY